MGYAEIFLQCYQAGEDFMSDSVRINDMVIRFANVNGTGSASVNDLFSKIGRAHV